MKLHHKESASLDGTSALLSSLCLVHCLLLPLALAISPMLAVGLVDELVHGPVWMHWLLIALAAPVSVYALWRGAHAHGNRYPWWLALAGFALMAAGALAHGFGPIESALTVTGGLVVAFAHWRNWKARQV
ncbi:MerC domain-containing protein [Sandaracinobacter sp. RS1-74]|uniref:MerC domain-containing protein n=1 Tax=Sandaracinobacteroides sayramensis TaxID=2913411 RepID=UPI001EDA1A1C|nr:MerC domain-containing protein [Sandaracinobacteroides sayramensis]